MAESRSMTSPALLAQQVEFTEAHGPIGTGVAFQALVDGETVICIATGAALSFADNSPFGEDLLGQYQRNRQLLRDAAEVLILAGRSERGMIEIRQEDIHSPKAVD
jgi:hypothetical protein